MIGVLEAAADFFYDPYVYWGLPLLLAVLREAMLRPGSTGPGSKLPGGPGGRGNPGSR